MRKVSSQKLCAVKPFLSIYAYMCLIVFSAVWWCCSCGTTAHQKQSTLPLNQSNSNNHTTALTQKGEVANPSRPLQSPLITSAEKTQIHPGYGTTYIHLGVSRGYLLSILGKPDEEYLYDNYDKACGVHSDMHWSTKINSDGTMEPGDGIFVYLRDDKVFGISFSDKKYFTTGRIAFDMPFDEVKKIPEFDTIAFTLTNSADHASNYKDYFYLVDRDKGIAFEMGHALKTKNSYVNGINVFSPGTDFVPMGCIATGRTFVHVVNTEN